MGRIRRTTVGGVALLLSVWMSHKTQGFVVKSPITQQQNKALHSATMGEQAASAAPPAFLTEAFNSECDNMNNPPSLNILLKSIQDMCCCGSSDIRGRFVDHPRLGSIPSAAHAIAKATTGTGAVPSLTPLAVYFIGQALAQQMVEENSDSSEVLTLAIGRDPRPHGMRLADALARGAESVQGVRAVYTGLASTPAMASLLRLQDVHAAVMVTASHLPNDRNGLKLYTPQATSGMTPSMVNSLGRRAQDCLQAWFSSPASSQLPPSSGGNAVMCSEWVDWMPLYRESLRNAIVDELKNVIPNAQKPLEGLKIVVNAGHGCGGFFASILEDLGADALSASIGLEENSDFPLGVPNPEYKPMLQQTIQQCEQHEADLGIMFDTDADRCGFVVPGTVDAASGAKSDYQPFNRNRLIALLGVIFARTHPGCAIVTDSCTSEGLQTFLEESLGLQHVRFVKGYANVIGKARQLTLSGDCDAQVAVETSGHGAMRENGYLDDGTYTAVKAVSLLARERYARGGGKPLSLLELIKDLPEVAEVGEWRLNVLDESLETTARIFDSCALAVEEACFDPDNDSWTFDADNLEGIRVKLGDNQFFMVRKSLHDPIISIQVEANSQDEARTLIAKPLLEMWQSQPQIASRLDLTVLQDY